jgi:mono/diheme cytochrome c family protein
LPSERPLRPRFRGRRALGAAAATLVCAAGIARAAAGAGSTAEGAGSTATADFASATAHRTTTQAGIELGTRLGCGGCHGAPFGAPPPGAPPLAGIGLRYTPAALADFITSPRRVRPALAPARMPRFPLHAGEAEAIAAYLLSLGAADAPGAPRGRAARGAAEIAAGRALVGALGCAACHVDLAAADLSPNAPAPDLIRSAAAMRGEALRGYLRAPRPVRPFGTPPGTGGRMPDFGLDPGEVDALFDALRSLAAAAAADTPVGATEAAVPAPLPRYARATAETLLRERLPCLGCHALDGEGGRIGPELGAVGARLAPAAIAAIVDDPQANKPGTAMPRVPLSEYERRRVIGYLAGRTATAARTAYLAPGEHPLLPTPAPGDTGAARSPDARADYLRFCAACHGAQGGGDGFNARYLEPRPTVHTDAVAMAPRPDDALFDALAVGGRIMGRSAAMPMFGETLPPARLRALVAYLRDLCACEAPSWEGRR